MERLRKIQYPCESVVSIIEQFPANGNKRENQRGSLEACFEDELVGQHVHVRRIDIGCLAECLPCLGVVLLPDVGDGLRVLGIGRLRRQAQRLLEVGERFFLFLLVQGDEAAVILGLHELRAELQQCIVALERRLVVALALLGDGEVVVRRHRVRL